VGKIPVGLLQFAQVAHGGVAAAATAAVSAAAGIRGRRGLRVGRRRGKHVLHEGRGGAHQEGLHRRRIDTALLRRREKKPYLNSKYVYALSK